MFQFDFLKKAMSDDATGQPSAKRVSLLTSTLFMGFSLMGLVYSFITGKTVDAGVFWAITVPLSLMCGASYAGVEGVKAFVGGKVIPSAGLQEDTKE